MGTSYPCSAGCCAAESLVGQERGCQPEPITAHEKMPRAETLETIQESSVWRYNNRRTRTSHVEEFLVRLPADVYASLKAETFEAKCNAAFECSDCSNRGVLREEGLVIAVRQSIPAKFLENWLQVENMNRIALTFKLAGAGEIEQEEFVLFCMWVIAMSVYGFATGTSPFAIISDIRTHPDATNLLIVSESLDPKHELIESVLPTTLCIYYEPQRITMDEFLVQLESVVHLRTGHGCFFKRFFESVAFVNHPPDIQGNWTLFSGCQVHLQRNSEVRVTLVPIFKALGCLVANPNREGHVDLLASNFVATQGGMNCLKIIEKEARINVAASIDDTGNVALGDTWSLNTAPQNVLPIYIDARKFQIVQKLMSPSKWIREQRFRGNVSSAEADQAKRLDNAVRQLALANLGVAQVKPNGWAPAEPTVDVDDVAQGNSGTCRQWWSSEEATYEENDVQEQEEEWEREQAEALEQDTKSRAERDFSEEHPGGTPQCEVTFVNSRGECPIIIIFKKRPLGIRFGLPLSFFPASWVRVKGFKKWSYASDVGVQKGWLLTKVGDEDVSTMAFKEAVATLHRAVDALPEFHNPA